MPDGTTRLRGAAAALPAAAARAIRRERTARDYLPYLGHAAPWAMLLEGGGLLGMLRLDGAAWETADPEEVNGAHARLNVLLRNIASDRLVLLVHVVRTFADAREYPAGRFRSGFAEALDAAYRERLLGRTLYRNHVFVSVLRRPPLPAGERVGSWLARRRGPAAEATAADLRILDETMQVLAADLDGYGAVRLGLRAANGIAFSEIGEALRLVLTGEELPVPLVNGHLGSAIHTDRVIVGREAIEMRGPAGSTYAAMFGLREYPATTWPGQFDAILSAPYRCVLTQGFGFLSKAAGQGVLTRKQNQMVSAQDKAASQREALSEASDQLQSNVFVMGDHHLSLMVLADGLPQLADAAAEARRDLADGGAVVVREDLGLEAAYWAQLPGNAHLRARPGVVSSRNFAAMAPLHGYPQGAATGQWGGPLALFRASGGTPFRFHFHVGDLGNVAMFGPSGSGKTTLLGFLLAMSEKAGAQVVLFDKDRGAEILARAVGGTYLVLPSGEPTGLAPLKALTNGAADLDFLADWVRGLIAPDGAALSAEDERRIELGLAAVMALPPEARSLGELRAFLGQSDPEGAGARLERWCDGRALGWAFDGEADAVSLDAPFLGFDMTALLDDPVLRGPAMAYLFHRIEALLDGRRLVVAIDEFWKALADPAFRAVVNDKLKTIRKLNGVMLLATQSPRDALASPIAHSLVEQCPTQLLMPNPRAAEKDYRDGLKLTGPEFRMVREDLAVGARGRFLVKQGTASVACDLDLSGLEELVAVLSGRASTVALMERLRAAHGPAPEAWLPAFLREWRTAGA
jgi:type IV secretion system protein VirB4